MEQLNLYYKIITDCWRLFKRFYEVQDTDAYWNAVTREGSKIYELYKCDFAKQIILLVQDELQKIGQKTGKAGQ